jgi:putative oxidoreductase
MKNIFLKSAPFMLATLFITFGLNKFLNYMVIPPPMDPAAQAFMTGMFSSYLSSLVGFVELFSSVLLLFRRTRFLGFLIIIPVILNIILYHLTTNDIGNPIILIIGVIFGAVCYSQKDAVKELLKIQSNI